MNFYCKRCNKTQIFQVDIDKYNRTTDSYRCHCEECNHTIMVSNKRLLEINCPPGPTPYGNSRYPFMQDLYPRHFSST